MTQKDQVFVADVMVIDLTREIVVSNVISQLISVVTKLDAIANIPKYRGLHEGHHFIPMTMEVHLGVIWIVSSRNVLVFSMIDN